MASLAFVVSACAIVLISRVRMRRRASAAQCARGHLTMLHRIRELTDLSAGDVAALLGTTPEQIGRWEATGVPAARQPAVVGLLRVALALRRELPSSAAGRLLRLRQRRATELERLEQVRGRAAALSRRYLPRHIVITTRL